MSYLAFYSKLQKETKGPLQHLKISQLVFNSTTNKFYLHSSRTKYAKILPWYNADLLSPVSNNILPFPFEPLTSFTIFNVIYYQSINDHLEIL